MKKHLVPLFLLGLPLLLSSCATLSPETTAPDLLHQQMGATSAQKLDTLLNTAKDSTTTNWQNSAGDTQYQLMLNDTYVNAQGQPCRHYQLQIHRDYYRTQVTEAIACRDDEGKWRLNR